MNADDLDRLFRLHRDLPREAPGSDAATRDALARLPDPASVRRILDIGCGPGAQSLVLARETGGHVTAVDIHIPYLEELRRRAAGIGDRITPCAASMTALPFGQGGFDLVWSEGAVYIMGFAEGLRAWRGLLAPGGTLAVTEATWLVDTPPEEAARFWAGAYPAMTTIAGNHAAAQRAGYRVLDTIPLPRAAWWDDYYTPLSARCDALRRDPHTDAAMTALIAETEREMDLHRRHGDTFGYVFYLLRPV